MFNRLFSAFLRDKEELSPGDRSGHKATIAGPYIIIYGGYNNFEYHRVYTELWFYHIYFKKWHRFLLPSNYSKTTLSSSILFYDGKIYMFGGTGFPFAQECNDYITVFDVEKHTWNIAGAELENLYQPQKKYCQSMVHYDNKLYVYGGTSGFNENNELNVFDLTQNAWIPIDPPQSGIEPHRSFRHEAVVFNHKMFIIGGAMNNTAQQYSFVTIISLDLKTHVWEEHVTIGDQLFNYPSNRSCFAIAQNDEYLFFSGGKDGLGNVCEDIWKLNLLNMIWTKLNFTLKCPVYFHSMVYGCDDRLYIFGGIKNDSNTRTNTLQIITHRVQRLMHIAADVVGSDSQFEEFCNRPHSDPTWTMSTIRTLFPKKSSNFYIGNFVFN